MRRRYPNRSSPPGPPILPQTPTDPATILHPGFSQYAPDKAVALCARTGSEEAADVCYQLSSAFALADTDAPIAATEWRGI